MACKTEVSLSPDESNALASQTMFYLAQKLGPAPTMFFFWSLSSLYRRFTAKLETPIPISVNDLPMIACVFTEITSVGIVISGVTDLTDYTWVIHHVGVVVASITSCVFLYGMWSNPQRFSMRIGAKRKIGLFAAFVISLSLWLPMDLIFLSFLPMQNEYSPSPFDLTTRTLVYITGNPNSSIGVGSLICWIDAIFISIMVDVLFEAKSRNQTKRKSL